VAIRLRNLGDARIASASICGTTTPRRGCSRSGDNDGSRGRIRKSIPMGLDLSRVL